VQHGVFRYGESNGMTAICATVTSSLMPQDINCDLQKKTSLKILNAMPENCQTPSTNIQHKRQYCYYSRYIF